jgi:hypothetical protein
MADDEQGGVADRGLRSRGGTDIGQSRGHADHLGSDRVPFVVVGVEQLRVRPTLDDEGELPGEVRRVLHAGVHPLCPGRAVDVGGVAGEEDPAVAVAGNLRVVHLEVGQPARVAHLHVAAHAGVGKGLDLLQGGVARIGTGRVDEEHDPGPGTHQREQDPHAVGVGEHPDGVAGERGVDVDVGHGEVLAVEAAHEVRADELPDGAVTAVGAHHPPHPCALLSVAGAEGDLDPVGVLGQRGQLDAAIHDDPELGGAFGQHGLARRDADWAPRRAPCAPASAPSHR